MTEKKFHGIADKTWRSELTYRGSRLLSMVILFLLVFLGMLKFLAVIQAGRLGERFNQVIQVIKVPLDATSGEQD